MYFRYFVIISPWRRAGPFIHNKIWIPSTQGCFVWSLVEIGSLVLEKKPKKWKVYNDTNNNDDDGQRTNFDQKSSLELSAQLSKKCSSATHNFLPCVPWERKESNQHRILTKYNVSLLPVETQEVMTFEKGKIESDMKRLNL